MSNVLEQPLSSLVECTERRRQTRNNLYRYFYESDEPRSKRDISVDLMLSPPTVNQHLNELLDAGLVRKNGLTQSTGGRRAVRYAIDENARFSLGISVSNHSLRILAANLRMHDIAYRECLMEENMPLSEIGKLISDESERFMTDFGLNREKLLGIGIALPGVLDSQHQHITFAPTLCLDKTELHLLTDNLSYPFFISNDATSGGYAEWFASSTQESMAYLSLENGVGGAVLIGGAPYNGTHERSGEFGHICVHPDGILCKCGKNGCLEAYCSAARISDDLGITPEKFFLELEAGNTEYEAIWDDFLEHLARGIHSIRMVLDSNIVIGGFMSQYIEKYMGRLKQLCSQLDAFEINADYITLCRYPKLAIPLGVALHFIWDFIEKL